MEIDLVIPPKDPERLAEAIRIQIGNPKLAGRLDHNTQKFIFENYTQEKAAKKHFEMFSSM